MKKIELNVSRVIYGLLGVTLTFDVLLSLSQYTLYENLSSVLLLVAPILIMVYIISTQSGRKSTWKTSLLFLMLFLIFVLETGVVIGHGLSPTPLFNVLAVIAYTGLIRIFLEKKWIMELTTLKRWSFGL